MSNVRMVLTTPFALCLTVAMAPSNAADAKTAAQFLTEAGVERITTRIVTTADPTDSALASRFDDTMNAISAAAAALGFDKDRQYLPWSAPAASEPSAEADNGPALHTQPGVLLFRRTKTSEDTDWLAFLVVIERPTTGVFVHAMREALQLARHYDSTPAIIGPYFSGTAPSLARVLGEDLKEPTRARMRVITTASGNQVASLLGPVATFERTAHTTSTLLNALYAYLVGEGKVHADDHRELQDVALLYEETTAFGREAHPGANGHTYYPRLTYPFPMHISLLPQVPETPAGDDKSPSFAGLSTPSLSISSQSVQDAVFAPAQPHDQVPQYSPATSVYTDLAVRSILRNICAAKVRYVGIVASDVRDVIFLVDRMQQTCPDTRLFTLDSQQLYAHPHFFNDMGGMLLASTYPLGFPEPDRPILAGSEAIATYNATLLSLQNDPPRLLSYSYWLPQHPVWISAVRRGGFSVLKQTPLDSASDAPFAPSVKTATAEMGAEGRAQTNRVWECTIVLLNALMLWPWWHCRRVFARRQKAGQATHVWLSTKNFAAAGVALHALGSVVLWSGGKFIDLREGSDWAYFFARSSHLFGGLSPVLPMSLSLITLQWAGTAAYGRTAGLLGPLKAPPDSWLFRWHKVFGWRNARWRSNAVAGGLISAIGVWFFVHSRGDTVESKGIEIALHFALCLCFLTYVAQLLVCLRAFLRSQDLRAEITRNASATFRKAIVFYMEAPEKAQSQDAEVAALRAVLNEPPHTMRQRLCLTANALNKRLEEVIKSTAVGAPQSDESAEFVALFLTLVVRMALSTFARLLCSMAMSGACFALTARIYCFEPSIFLRIASWVQLVSFSGATLLLALCGWRDPYIRALIDNTNFPLTVDRAVILRLAVVTGSAFVTLFAADFRPAAHGAFALLSAIPGVW